MSYDIKVVGASIVDGTGGAAFAGDIGVKDGAIVAIGQAPASAQVAVDGTGLVVAPGFIDCHTHYDAQVLWDPQLTISPWHGVTTVVMGNCGFGIAPTRPSRRQLVLRTLERVEGMSLAALNRGLGDDWGFTDFASYLDAIERRGTAINVAAFVGHTPVRLEVMGEAAAKRAATADEVRAMARLVAEAMEAGAIGFSTSYSPHHVGFDSLPVPSRLASVDQEIRPLIAAMAGTGRGLVQATGGSGLFLDEFATLSRDLGVPITWTALMSGLNGPGSHRPLLERTAMMTDAGLRVTPQATCRPLNFEFSFEEPTAFASLPLFAEPLRADGARRRALYRDDGFRDAFKRALARGVDHPFAGWFDRTVVSRSPDDPSIEERLLDDVARERGVDPVDLALDLSLASDGAARFRLAMFNYNADEVAEILSDPRVVLGLSDAGAHASQLCDACFATHLLSYWVRERHSIGLERAVHMLTGRVADVFGLSDRGRIALGRPADLVVFDPATVGAGALERRNDLPGGAERLISEAHGIRAVICNGNLIRDNGKDVVGERFPGRVLRRAGRW